MKNMYTQALLSQIQFFLLAQLMMILIANVELLCSNVSEQWTSSVLILTLISELQYSAIFSSRELRHNTFNADKT